MLWSSSFLREQLLNAGLFVFQHVGGLFPCVYVIPLPSARGQTGHLELVMMNTNVSCPRGGGDHGNSLTGEQISQTVTAVQKSLKELRLI